MKNLSRRDFLGALGVGAAVIGGGGVGCSAAAEAEGPTSASRDRLLADGDEFGREMRALFVLDPNLLYMNIGTVGSPPLEVLDLDDATHRTVARDALSTYGSRFEDVRQRAAADFGCDPDELAISHNTSDSMSKILAGLELRRGDEILTTNHEHIAADSPMALLRDRYGVAIKRIVVPLGNDQRAEDYVEKFRAAITWRTKVMLFSAPTYKTGTMLPIRMLSELAQARGLTTVVDGAHLPGMMKVDLHGWGIDFFAGAGGKWQCGPAGTGVLYARNKVLSEYNAQPLPNYWPVISSVYPAAGGLPPRTRTRIESYDIGSYLQGIGNDSLATMAAFKRACEIWNRVGRQRIEDYVLGLSAYLKDQIVARWGIGALVSPKDDPRLSSALTSFYPFADPADVTNRDKIVRFIDQMKAAHRVVVRFTDFPADSSGVIHFAVRVSTHLFHTRAEIDRAVSAMWEVSRSA